MYEKKTLMMSHEFCINTCPHCGRKFVVLTEWDSDSLRNLTIVVEQVGPTIYCYMCGKRFDETVSNNKT